nr:MAG TPA: Protein of unknown function (DUF722) [Caudoviricetes sp.]
MREYGDYIRETKRLLQNYAKMKVAVTNLTEEIEAQEMILRDESISSIQYGDDRISGGTRELTSTEAAAARRIKLEGHIADMRIRRDDMERTIRAIDRAFESLDDADVELLRERYMRGLSWAELAEDLNYTEKWAKEKGGKVLRDVALMLFGGEYETGAVEACIYIRPLTIY